MDFTKDNLEKPCKEWLKAEGKECNASKHSAKGHYEKVKRSLYSCYYALYESVQSRMVLSLCGDDFSGRCGCDCIEKTDDGSAEDV